VQHSRNIILDSEKHFTLKAPSQSSCPTIHFRAKYFSQDLLDIEMFSLFSNIVTAVLHGGLHFFYLSEFDWNITVFDVKIVIMRTSMLPYLKALRKLFIM